MIEVRPAKPRDEVTVAGVSGQSEALVSKVFAAADEVWIGEADGEFVCCWGIQSFSFMTQSAVIWMYAGSALSQHRMAFLRRNRQFCRERAQGRELFAVTQAYFDVSRKWLCWLGFSPLGPRTVDGLDLILYRFGGV